MHLHIAKASMLALAGWLGWHYGTGIARDQGIQAFGRAAANGRMTAAQRAIASQLAVHSPELAAGMARLRHSIEAMLADHGRR